MRQHFFVVLFVVTIGLAIGLADTTVVSDIQPSDTCDKCCQGQPGNNGINGQNGLPGRDGLRGNPGSKGERGESTLGPSGLAGIQGPEGPVGGRGQMGPRGFPGKVGPVGMRGLPGTNGRDGTPGMEGLQGQKGDVGVPSAQSAFMVLRSSTQSSSSSHKTLDFTLIRTNVGNDFDINTDRFTCQIPGVYVFNYHAENGKGNYLEILLMLNDGVVTMAATDDVNDIVAGSAILVLEEGDQVWLQFDDIDEVITCNSNKGCGFTGFLLYEN